MRAALALLVVLAAAAPAQAQEPFLEPDFLASIDDAQLHGTITPPGSDNAHATTELNPYDDLVQAYPSLTADRLGDFFKLRLFGDPSPGGRTYSPRPGVTVVRDARWGEPAIYGTTDDDMAFGAGWVAAEDRLPIMELLRSLGRGEAFELLGTVPAWLADAEIARVYGYTEKEFQAMIDRLPEVYGQTGADIKTMLDAHVAGINAYVSQTGQGVAPWRPTDVVAVVSIVRALFGAGGGSELANATVLAQLAKDYGPDDARRIYEDMRNRDNRDGPVHTTKVFPYMQRDPSKLDPRATALDVTSGSDGISGSIAQLLPQVERLEEDSRVKWERLNLGGLNFTKRGMSNHLVVGASRSATGRPILLGGPQAGYFSPEILMDYELHSPTIHARGAGFPGLSTLVVLGRTQNYAWTPTAGGSDMIDTYVEKLCSPSGGPVSEESRYYEYKGECLEMDRRTLRTASSAPAEIRDRVPDIIVERTVHGPVMARGKVGDVPVAITQKRSTYLKELDPAVSILKMNRNEARSGEDFVRIFHESHNLSTNWSYANDHEIAYVHGGLYPRRPLSVDPDLPVWGTGEWEWGDTFLSSDEVPHEVAPARDFFVSWNNRPAPGWGASDAQWGWTSLHRGRLVEEAITREPRGSITPTRLVQVMEEAGLTDLRGRFVGPLLLRLVSDAALAPREARMVELLREWIAEGALRRDGDEDGDYDRTAAVAIMDALWEPLIREVFEPAIGDPARIPLGFDNAPSSGGSAYETGFYGQVLTQLSMALGERLSSPTSRLYCGGTPAAAGTRESCRDRVVAALVRAGDALGDDESSWKADAEGERIRFLPGAALSMHWVNRPTTQGLAMFGRLGRHQPAPSAACFRRRLVAGLGARSVRRGLRVRLKQSVRVSLVRFVPRPRRSLSLGVHARDFVVRRRFRDGWYALRFGAVHRIALRRVRGRWRVRGPLDRRFPCGALSSVWLGAPVFTSSRPLRVRFRLSERATVRVLIDGRQRHRATYSPGRRSLTFRVRGRGVHRVKLLVGSQAARLRARRL